MDPIRKQILYDEHLNPIQVLIPFEDWQRIEAQLGRSEEPNAAALMRFAGKIAFNGDPVEIQRRMRAEWPD